MATGIAGLPSLEVRSRVEKGRAIHVAAPSGLPAGTTVLCEIPYSSVVVCTSATLCAVCYALADPDLCCDDCSGVMFCSEACQILLNDVHALECSTLEDIDLIAKKSCADRNLLRLLTRILCTRVVQQSRDATDSTRITTTYDDVADMVHATSQLDEAWITSVQAGAELLVKSLPRECAVPVAEIVGLAARVNENSYSLDANTADALGEIAAVGLFPVAGLFNHSCHPNCIWSTDTARGAMVLRTTTFIGPGEEVTVPYIDVNQPRDARRRQLKASKHFDCQCDRCDAPLVEPALDSWVDGVCCHACKDALLVAPKATSPSGYACTRCGWATSQEVVDAAKANASSLVNSAVALVEKKQFKQAREVLVKFCDAQMSESPTSSSGVVLHPSHWAVTTALRLLSDCCFKLGAYVACHEYRVAHVTRLEATLQANALALGTAYFELAEAVAIGLTHKVWSPDEEQLKRAQLKAHYERCRDVRKICYVAGHPRLAQVEARLRSL